MGKIYIDVLMRHFYSLNFLIKMYTMLLTFRICYILGHNMKPHTYISHPKTTHNMLRPLSTTHSQQKITINISHMKVGFWPVCQNGSWAVSQLFLFSDTLLTPAILFYQLVWQRMLQSVDSLPLHTNVRFTSHKKITAKWQIRSKQKTHLNQPLHFFYFCTFVWHTECVSCD